MNSMEKYHSEDTIISSNRSGKFFLEIKHINRFKVFEAQSVVVRRQYLQLVFFEFIFVHGTFLNSYIVVVDNEWLLTSTMILFFLRVTAYSGTFCFG